MATQTEFLNTIPYFTGLGESGIKSISRYVYEKKAGRGELLVAEGVAADVLYFVVEGVVSAEIIEITPSLTDERLAFLSE